MKCFHRYFFCKKNLSLKRIFWHLLSSTCWLISGSFLQGDEEWGVSYSSQKFAHPPNKFLSQLSPTSCSHCSDTIFILTEYSLYRHVMLILILIDIQHLQNVAFAFENGSNGQNHSLPDTSHSLPHWGGFFSGRLFLTHL